MRKIFDVIICGKNRPVYDIPNKEHMGLNDTPKTWWLYMDNEPPEGLIPPSDSDRLMPFSKHINRRLWTFNISQHQYTKEKWDETSIRSSTTVEMACNGIPVYQFTTTGTDYGLSYAMAKIQYLQVVLSEHAFDFFDQKSENGRLIFFYGLPATIRVSSTPGEIGIIPDYTVGLNKAEWWSQYLMRKGTATPDFDSEWRELEDEEDKESGFSDYINWGDALSDGHINWFRKLKQED